MQTANANATRTATVPGVTRAAAAAFIELNRAGSEYWRLKAQAFRTMATACRGLARAAEVDPWNAAEVNIVRAANHRETAARYAQLAKECSARADRLKL